MICLSSLWCQSRLYSKLYNMRKQEVKEVQKIVNDFNQKVNVFYYLDINFALNILITSYNLLLLYYCKFFICVRVRARES